ncbi:hypothetical protein [Alicyclobacillus sendaiensis]|uniref:hypothetical protein n=1 Tax=Alicyclobacillus sendaiensis TaxID=192387 RepID=UPI0026F450B5|nr:hypothetical protein [Alicyclobacillus sendaiensis]
MNYFFLYQTSSGQLYGTPYLGTAMEWTNIPEGCGVIGPIDQSDPTATDAYQHPERYLIQNGELVLQPYLTVSSSGSNGEYTITATLNNPPSTPPTSVTLTIGSWTQAVTLSNNQANLTVQLHPSLANYAVPVSVSASGCVGASTTIGGTQTLPIGIQVYMPSGSSTPMIAPVGPGSKSFLAAYYSLSAASLETYLADIGTVISLLTDAVFNVLFPSVNPSLNANQQNAYNDLKANALPNLYTTLNNAYPSGGQKQLQYTQYLAGLSSTFKAYESYTQDLETIPGLE